MFRRSRFICDDVCQLEGCNNFQSCKQREWNLSQPHKMARMIIILNIVQWYLLSRFRLSEWANVLERERDCPSSATWHDSAPRLSGICSKSESSHSFQTPAGVSSHVKTLMMARQSVCLWHVCWFQQNDAPLNPKSFHSAWSPRKLHAACSKIFRQVRQYGMCVISVPRS